ncbi:MAG: hypothetical protein ACTIIQ_10470, partial [Corynebacterium variabile]|uniref:hypothetical protein n=1 Tax=Corynebacterium variabile TaxID=1727 RepID=UPI003F95AA5E
LPRGLHTRYALPIRKSRISGNLLGGVVILTECGTLRNAVAVSVGVQSFNVDTPSVSETLILLKDGTPVTLYIAA